MVLFNRRFSVWLLGYTSMHSGLQEERNCTFDLEEGKDKINTGCSLASLLHQVEIGRRVMQGCRRLGSDPPMQLFLWLHMPGTKAYSDIWMPISGKTCWGPTRPITGSDLGDWILQSWLGLHLSYSSLFRKQNINHSSNSGSSHTEGFTLYPLESIIRLEPQITSFFNSHIPNSFSKGKP